VYPRIYIRTIIRRYKSWYIEINTIIWLSRNNSQSMVELSVQSYKSNYIRRELLKTCSIRLCINFSRISMEINRTKTIAKKTNISNQRLVQLFWWSKKRIRFKSIDWRSQSQTNIKNATRGLVVGIVVKTASSKSLLLYKN